MSNLTTLKDDFKAKRFYDIAETIIKYQKFKSKIIAEKLLLLGVKKDYALRFISVTRNYLITGKKSMIANLYFEKIDEILAKHVQPLIPKKEEEYRMLPNFFQKKEAVLPIQKIECVQTKQTALIDYGIKIDDKILLCKNEVEARGFLKAIDFINAKCEAKIVTVEVQEVKESE